MLDLTEECYQKHIPSCCEFKTTKEHMDHMLLCWSITKSIETGEPIVCGKCEMNTDMLK